MSLIPASPPANWKKSFSYPSGHSTESMVLALVLAEVFPDKHDAIVAEAATSAGTAWKSREHYPTDIYAGRVLAQAIIQQMNKNRRFQQDFAAAKAEVAAGGNRRQKLTHVPTCRTDFRFHPARHQPQQVGQTIEINDDLGVFQFAAFPESTRVPFRPAANRSRHVQGRRIRCVAPVSPSL